MAAVDTNSVGIQIADESSLGVLPGSPAWKVEEPMNVTQFGATVTTKARKSIRRKRGRRPAVVTDLDSTVEMEEGLTYDSLSKRLPRVMFSALVGPPVFYPTAVTSTGYTVASGGAIANGLLIYASGFTNPENNGLKLLAGTSTGTEVKTTGLVAETAADLTDGTRGAKIEVCGWRFAGNTAAIDADGNLTDSANSIPISYLTVGQAIWIGGDGGNFVFSTAGSGFARILAKAAGELTLDQSAFAADAGGVGKTIEIRFGRFCRDVSEVHADFQDISQRIEAAFPDLDGGSDAFGYAVGCKMNTWNVTFPLTDLVTVEQAWVNTDTNPPTTSRATNASAGQNPVIVEPFSTAIAYRRLQLTTYTGTVLSQYLKTLTLEVNNNISAEKVQAQLGAYRLNRGDQEYDVKSTWIFDDPDQMQAVRDNDKMSLQLALCTATDRAGFYLDIPACRLGDGSPNLPVNETVTIDLPMMVEEDAVLGYQMSWSLFPHLPAV